MTLITVYDLYSVRTLKQNLIFQFPEWIDTNSQKTSAVFELNSNNGGTSTTSSVTKVVSKN